MGRVTPEELNAKIRNTLSPKYIIRNKVKRVIDYVYFSDEFGEFRMQADSILRGAKITTRSTIDYYAYLKSYVSKVHPDIHILENESISTGMDKVLVEFKGLHYSVFAWKLLCSDYTPKVNSDCLDRKAIVESKVKSIWGDQYDFTKTDFSIPVDNKVTATCPIHGDFNIRLAQLLSSHGCRKCANAYVSVLKSQTLKEYIAKAHKRHKHKYDYSLMTHYKRDCVVPIICHEHGVFWRNNRAHLQGAGCPKCTRRTIDTLYLLYDNYTNLYKIGISTGFPDKRIKRFQEGSKLSPKQRQVMVVHTWDDNAYLFEKRIHKHFAEYQYEHPYYSKGSMEWFHFPFTPKEIIQNINILIKQYKNESNKKKWSSGGI